jgi:hypothetical protein
MFIKWFSRKLLVTLGYFVLAGANSRYNLNLPMTEILGMAGTYVLGQSAVDVIDLHGQYRPKSK